MASWEGVEHSVLRSIHHLWGTTQDQFASRIKSVDTSITLEALHKAFKAVKRNRGAAGLDKQSIKRFEANLEENLVALMRELKSGSYQPIPLRRVYIPKGKGGFRPLGIPIACSYCIS